MNDYQLNKTVLITGCSSGLGLQFAKQFLANQWKVIATFRQLDQNHDLMQSNHPLLTVMKLDVTQHADREAITQYIINHLDGKLDCLINNAGYGQFGALEELTEEQIREQLEVNLTGVILLTQACLFAIRESRGRIINVSSVLGYIAFPLQSLYVASKFALEGFSESLHYELQSHAVQVSLLELGVCQTRFGKNAKVSFPEKNLPEYHQQTLNLGKFRELLLNSKKLSPEKVALQVMKIVNSPKMPMRLRVGKDAISLYYLRRFLPSQAFTFIMSYFYKRIFRAAI